MYFFVKLFFGHVLHADGIEPFFDRFIFHFSLTPGSFIVLKLIVLFFVFCFFAHVIKTCSIPVLSNYILGALHLNKVLFLIFYWLYVWLLDITGWIKVWLYFRLLFSTSTDFWAFLRLSLMEGSEFLLGYVYNFETIGLWSEWTLMCLETCCFLYERMLKLD